MNLLNQINIIISKHSIQRRKHKKPTDKNILIELVKQIDYKYHISKKKNNRYRIGFKNTVAVIKKTDDSLLLITAYGFEKYSYKIDNIKLKVSIATSKEERKLKRETNIGVIHIIFRTNSLDKKVECGTICDVKNSKDSEDKKEKNVFKYKLILDWKLFLKFDDIPIKPYHLYFNNFSEISNIVHLENEEYFLNDLKRKEYKKQRI